MRYEHQLSILRSIYLNFGRKGIVQVFLCQQKYANGRIRYVKSGIGWVMTTMTKPAATFPARQKEKPRYIEHTAERRFDSPAVWKVASICSFCCKCPSILVHRTNTEINEWIVPLCCIV